MASNMVNCNFCVFSRVLKYVGVVSSDSSSSEGNSPKHPQGTTPNDDQVSSTTQQALDVNNNNIQSAQQETKNVENDSVQDQPETLNFKTIATNVASSQQLQIKKEKDDDEQFQESDAAEVLLAMASGSLSNASPANRSSITSYSISPHSATLLNMSQFNSTCMIKQEPNETVVSSDSYTTQEIKVEPGLGKHQYGVKGNSFSVAPKISIISSKPTDGVPASSPSINATKIYKIVSGGEQSSSPTSAYITIIKRNKKEQPIKINNKAVSQTKGEPVLPSDPDFKAFAESWHGLCTDVAGNEIHKCTLCCKVYTVYEAFVNHIRIHYKQQNKCSVCGKTFTRSWLLKGHMRTHTGERPYVCDFPGCEKAFADRSNLRSHTMIHKTKGKRYLCPMCDRAFAQKRYLHKHMAEVCKVPGCELQNSMAASSTQNAARYRTVLPKPSDSPSSTTSATTSTDSQMSQS